MISIMVGLWLNVLPILQFVFHFFPRYEQKYVRGGGGSERNAQFRFFLKNDVLELYFISADLCII